MSLCSRRTSDYWYGPDYHWTTTCMHNTTRNGFRPLRYTGSLGYHKATLRPRQTSLSTEDRAAKLANEASQKHGEAATARDKVPSAAHEDGVFVWWLAEPQRDTES